METADLYTLQPGALFPNSDILSDISFPQASSLQSLRRDYRGAASDFFTPITAASLAMPSSGDESFLMDEVIASKPEALPQACAHGHLEGCPVEKYFQSYCTFDKTFVSSSDTYLNDLLRYSRDEVAMAPSGVTGRPAPKLAVGQKRARSVMEAVKACGGDLGVEFSVLAKLRLGQCSSWGLLHGPRNSKLFLLLQVALAMDRQLLLHREARNLALLCVQSEVAVEEVPQSIPRLVYEGRYGERKQMLVVATLPVPRDSLLGLVERGAYWQAMEEDLVADVASALSYLARRNLVHGNVAPAEIHVVQEESRKSKVRFVLAGFSSMMPVGTTREERAGLWSSAAFRSASFVHGAPVQATDDWEALCLVVAFCRGYYVRGLRVGKTAALTRLLHPLEPNLQPQWLTSALETSMRRALRAYEDHGDGSS